MSYYDEMTDDQFEELSVVVGAICEGGKVNFIDVPTTRFAGYVSAMKRIAEEQYNSRLYYQYSTPLDWHNETQEVRFANDPRLLPDFLRKQQKELSPIRKRKNA